MTTKKIKTSDILGDNYYIYELTSSNYTPNLNDTITITCICKDIYGDNVTNKSLTLYQNGTSKGAQTTNSSGVATWSITCSSAGIQKFNIKDTSIEVLVDDALHEVKIQFEDKCSNDIKLSNYGDSIPFNGDSSNELVFDNNQYRISGSGGYFSGREIIPLYHVENGKVRIKFKLDNDWDSYNQLFICCTDQTPSSIETTYPYGVRVRADSLFQYFTFTDEETINEYHYYYNSDWYYLEAIKDGTTWTMNLYDNSLSLLTTDTKTNLTSMTSPRWYFGIQTESWNSNVYIKEIITETYTNNGIIPYTETPEESPHTSLSVLELHYTIDSTSEVNLTKGSGGFTYTGNVVIDYGDGTTEAYTGEGITHAYETTGDYIVQIKGDITEIKDGTFWKIESLTKAIIPNSVIKIEGSAFYKSTNLTEISIPYSVEEIGDYCFAYTTGLTSLVIPNSVKQIADHCFEYSHATSITLPNHVTNYVYTYNNNTGVTNVDIPEGVISIQGTFQACSNLKNVTLPKTLQTIGNSTFNNCTTLESIVFKSKTPPTVGEIWAFRNVPTTCKIIVPLSAIEAYKNTTNMPDPCQYEYIGWVDTTKDVQNCFEDKIIYQTDFTSDDSHWGVVGTNNRITITYSNDGCTVAGTGSYDRFYELCSSIQLPHRFICEFDITAATQGTYNESTDFVVGGIQIRQQDNKLRIGNADRLNDYSTTMPSFPIHIKVEHNMSSAIVYVNGLAVGSWTTTYDYIGFKTYQNRSITIKNLEIRPFDNQNWYDVNIANFNGNETIIDDHIAAGSSVKFTYNKTDSTDCEGYIQLGYPMPISQYDNNNFISIGVIENSGGGLNKLSILDNVSADEWFINLPNKNSFDIEIRVPNFEHDFFNFDTATEWYIDIVVDGSTYQYESAGHNATSSDNVYVFNRNNIYKVVQDTNSTITNLHYIRSTNSDIVSQNDNRLVTSNAVYEALKVLTNTIHPINSTYITTNPGNDPNDIFIGSWTIEDTFTADSNDYAIWRRVG